jgi:hypothetical protein
LLVCSLLVFAFLGPAAAGGELDKTIKRLQGEVDNEAVSVYGGNVGKLQAIFFIEWAGTGNPVAGYYYYPSRGRAKTYKLTGTNPKQGVLTLQEFTPKEDGTYEHSASCRLSKRVTDSRIIWEGKMNNTDGRVLPMKFSRPR